MVKLQPDYRTVIYPALMEWVRSNIPQDVLPESFDPWNNGGHRVFLEDWLLTHNLYRLHMLFDKSMTPAATCFFYGRSIPRGFIMERAETITQAFLLAWYVAFGKENVVVKAEKPPKSRRHTRRDEVESV